MAKTATKSEFSGFEHDFEHLGSIVERLEQGNISLEEMLKLYEEGTALAAKLVETLKTAELKVRTLSKVHEELASFETSPFEEEE
ncbi:MAG TPA: exodeoxyribonuclease VII small subunit [Candidatus Kapabacteria bacterium]|nr:exodeoxyribonuclease VII small subunit [Candidatus Kapabacteria bacterium]